MPIVTDKKVPERHRFSHSARCLYDPKTGRDKLIIQPQSYQTAHRPDLSIPDRVRQMLIEANIRNIDDQHCLELIGLKNIDTLSRTLHYFKSSKVSTSQRDYILKQTCKRKLYAEKFNRVSKDLSELMNVYPEWCALFILHCRRHCERILSENKQHQTVDEWNLCVKSKQEALDLSISSKDHAAGVLENQSIKQASLCPFWRALSAGFLPIITCYQRMVDPLRFNTIEATKIAASLNLELRKIIEHLKTHFSIALESKQKLSTERIGPFFRAHPPLSAHGIMPKLSMIDQRVNTWVEAWTSVSWFIIEECFIMNQQCVEKTDDKLCKIVNTLSDIYLTSEEKISLSPIFLIQSVLLDEKLPYDGLADWQAVLPCHSFSC